MNPTTQAGKALLADMRTQVRVASWPDPDGCQVVTWSWLDRWLAGRVQTFVASGMNGAPLPERIAHIEAEAEANFIKDRLPSLLYEALPDEYPALSHDHAAALVACIQEHEKEARNGA